MAADTDIETEGAEVEAPASGLARRKLLIMLAAAGIVMVAGGGGLYYYLSAAQADAARTSSVAAPPQTFIFNLPPITVNLNSEAGGDSYLRMTIALEVANEQMMKDIEPGMAKVIDAFQVYLRELRKSDLEGSAGIYRLKEELLRRVNIAIYPARVESILFRELLVQ